MRAAELAAALRAQAGDPGSVADGVRAIVADVRARGDEALQEYVDRFDGTGGLPVRVAREELDAALEALDPAVKDGLRVAIRNVHAVAAAGVGEDRSVALPEGHEVLLRELPVQRAAIYAPGGRNPYPSTVVMGVVTAKAAGVEDVVVTAPGAHPVILAACAMTGVDEVWRMGGAHAVAALAYGTESVRRVDVIAGPGGLWVQEAKRQVSGDVGIDGFYGPSDLLVVASGDARPELVAADLAAQAEHGEGTVVELVTDSAELARSVGRGVVVDDMEEALAVAEAFAPEHLSLQGAAAEALASRVRCAGCVFVGSAGAVAFGDYVAGSNHSLPTGGAARFASGLGARAFRRRMSVVRIGQAAPALARAGAPVARAEGFTEHARSMEIRQDPGT
jgi:histidinol dehydrogenase